MPTARRSRTISAPAEQLWEVVCDPHHLPRWWPLVVRVEEVEGGAFTEVLRTAKGKVLRADFQLLEADPSSLRLTWAQQLDGTPFAGVLKAAETEVSLESVERSRHRAGEEEGEASPALATARAPESRARASAPATRVTIELRQSLKGLFPRLGSHMVGRATAAKLEEALDGLERILSAG